MRIEDFEVERYRAEPGDLIICEGGEPGRCAVWNIVGEQVFIQKALHRIRFTESYEPRFAYLYMAFAALSHQMEPYFTGTTIKHLTGTGLRKIPFPLCSVHEQRQIISRLDEQLSANDALESDIDTNLQKAEALRQSILRKAFSGQLVSQDPNDDRPSSSSGKPKPPGTAAHMPYKIAFDS
jgi:type I restriction enzyme S subunit